jgi:hypothetical protein
VENSKEAIDILEKCVSEYKIFIETSSILDINASKFWMNMIPLLEKYRNKIIIPIDVIEELEKKDKLNSHLKSVVPEKLTDIKGEKNNFSIDKIFEEVFLMYRSKYKILLITQDSSLAKKITDLNKNKFIMDNDILCMKITEDGLLNNEYNINILSKIKSIFGVSKKNKSSKIKSQINQDEIFNIAKKVTNISDEKLKITNLPKENEVAYTKENKAIKLLKEVASGGEGIIYTTDTQYVAKIYKNENNTRRKYEKLKKMVSKKINCEGVCYPVELLYNKNKEFIGYLMPEAKGYEIAKSIFIPKLLLKKFPSWKKKDTVELCITILNKIKYLHDRNIIIGDINPRNILVSSPKKVYFVDTDSYQIGEFPCPVGMSPFKAPEILDKKEFRNFLRTKGNENFAIGTLLFMIMLPGKPPYAQQGGENMDENILKMNFSYPFEKKSTQKTPAGSWGYIWSHLPYRLKKEFYHTFMKGGDFSKEKSRLSVDNWLETFNEYLTLINNGILRSKDEMSDELFPTRYNKEDRDIPVQTISIKNNTNQNFINNSLNNNGIDFTDEFECIDLLVMGLKQMIKKRRKKISFEEALREAIENNNKENFLDKLKRIFRG